MGMEPRVLFEDEEVLVVDKPSGVVVNRAESVVGETVQDWVSARHSERSEESWRSFFPEGTQAQDDTPFYSRSGIVHRIDKETSGILLIAKTPEAFAELQRQFKEREIEKTYTALVHGALEPQSGMIKAPVGRLPWNRERFGVLAGGREAETGYKVISSWFRVDGKNKEQFALVEFYPKTGRTHQIRVHAKYIHHPLVADTYYAGRKTSRRDRAWCPRLFLHASRIVFTHPKSRERTSVESPLPGDLQKALADLN